MFIRFGRAILRQLRLLPEHVFRAVKQWIDDEGSLLAAAVSYYAALSLLPLLLVLISGLGVVLRFSGWGQDAKLRILEVISDQGAQVLADQVERALSEVQTQAAVSGPVGIVILLFAAVTIFANFEWAFDRIWGVEQRQDNSLLGSLRRIVFFRLKAFLMLLAVALLILISFVAGLLLSAATTLTEEFLTVPAPLWTALEFLVSVLINWLLITIIYKVLPKAKVRWREAFQGGLLTAICWQIGRQVLALFVIGDNFSAYGVVGAVIAILLWVYFAVTILFIGAEYVQIICLDCLPPDRLPEETSAAETTEHAAVDKSR